MSQSIGLCLWCVCVFVISDQSTSKTHVICVKLLVNLTPCCINHTVMCFWD